MRRKLFDLRHLRGDRRMLS